MALFRRKKTDSVLPEVDKYYEGERRDRAGLAWLMALISVIIVALIIIALFLAGRWLYRQVTKGDDSRDVAISEVEAPSFDGEPSNAEQEAEEKAKADQEAKEAEERRKAEEQKRTEEELAQGRVDAPARTDVPSTGDNAPLPSTGPANMIGIFAGVSSLAGGIHYVVERRRTK